MWVTNVCHNSLSCNEVQSIAKGYTSIIINLVTFPVEEKSNDLRHVWFFYRETKITTYDSSYVLDPK